MPTRSSRYRPDAAPDYSHRFHAGNVGDVWKHCVLTEVLRRAAAVAPVAYLESHAGDGRYALAPTGEWTEGIGRLWRVGAEGDDPVARYAALSRRLARGTERPTEYPGSPAFARAVLGPAAELVLFERDAAAFRALAAATHGDPHVRLAHADGLATLADEVRAAEARAAGVVALIDPPWASKADWTLVPDALVRAARASRHACLLLWYPVKSLTRPNAMRARLHAAGVAATCAELITTPLDTPRRNRLNGSGMLLVRPPAGACAAIAAAAPVLGEQCASVPGAWSFRMVAGE